MAKVVEIQNAPGQYTFKCPGCGLTHVIVTSTADPEQCYGNSRWQFNGDLNTPTVQPSLLVQWNDGDQKRICHFFITDGFLSFLNDCTHDKAGTKVEMPQM